MDNDLRNWYRMSVGVYILLALLWFASTWTSIRFALQVNLQLVSQSKASIGARRLFYCALSTYQISSVNLTRCMFGILLSSPRSAAILALCHVSAGDVMRLPAAGRRSFRIISYDCRRMTTTTRRRARPATTERPPTGESTSST